MRIYLTGFMGSGKSHLGRQLSTLLAVPFIDLDQEIETEANCRISEIFTEEGEEGFRKREQRCLFATRKLESAVIATGGGTPCFYNQMDWMNQHGLTLFLDVPIPVLVRRLQDEMNHRPLLQHLSREELAGYISTKLTERRPFYEKARVIYQPLTEEEHTPQRILEKIKDWL
jgi:shikimate kinase